MSVYNMFGTLRTTSWNTNRTKCF